MTSRQHSALVDQAQRVNEVTRVRKRAPEVPIMPPSYRLNTGLANELVLALGGGNPQHLAASQTLIDRALWAQGKDIS